MSKKMMFFYILAIALLGFSRTVWADDPELFSELIKNGKLIFNDLRELIFIAAGFGIIAVGIGGIFGNLNWKWLGAIIVSLIVIATAGEIISIMVGETDPVGNTINETNNGNFVRLSE